MLSRSSLLSGAILGLTALLVIGMTGALAASDSLAEQLSRGEDIYFASCAMCHNSDLSGGAMHAAPALAGDAFKARWVGRSVQELLSITRTTMPEGQPRSLDDQAYLDVVAFILKSNQVAQGESALTDTAAARISIK